MLFGVFSSGLVEILPGKRLICQPQTARIKTLSFIRYFFDHPSIHINCLKLKYILGVNSPNAINNYVRFGWL